MSDQRFPPSWTEERVQRLVDHYESLTEEEQLAEDETAVAEQHDRIVSEAEAIIRDVRRAFQDVAPGPLSLHQAAIVKHADEQELLRAKLLDSDVHLSQIADTDLEECSRALYGADALSWRYFIPAFMIWTLRHFKTSDAFLIDQTIYTFDSSDNNSNVRELALERYRGLSQLQCKAICRFLMYMAQNGDFVDDVVANRALAKYWFDRCSNS